MANEPVGIEYRVRRAGAVERFLRKVKREASDAERTANRAESKTKQTIAQLARTGFTALGGQVISFAVNEAIAQSIQEQGGGRLASYIGGVGASTLTGFAFGGVAGGLGAFLTGSISQLFSLVQDIRNKNAELEKKIEEERKRAEELIEKTRENQEARILALESRIERRREQDEKEAFQLLLNGYQYLNSA